ncbi:MAG: squalene synthase HpnC [Planctomycetaceae bacterium]|nr:squalene synthase HpnC [Planctomycetaceae bacterium]
MSVRDDLTRFGPDQQAVVDLRTAEAYCREIASTHYENFPVVSWLLPRHLHQHFYNVYAYCRWSDDLGDELGDPAQSLQMLAWWQSQLDACYAGECLHPVFVALRPTIERFAIPRDPFADLISAFVQDQTVHEYETYEHLRDYCRRSADPVGRIVLYLCEVFTPQRAELSDNVCTGLQLANFWQDVARDLDIGRIYLPAEDRARFGYTRDDYLQRRFTPQFAELMRFEVDRAKQLLLSGKPLIPQMPGRLQVDIDLFTLGGLEILRGIERLKYDVWGHRPTVSKGRLGLHLLTSLMRMVGRSCFAR